MSKQLLKLLYAVLLAAAVGGFAACGSGAGSGAAPSGGGDAPVAVEIPALGEASGLPFASGVVVVGSSDISAALKATKSSWVYKSFTLTNSDAFTTGNSMQACEYRNSAAIALGAMALPDQSLCSIQGSIDSFSAPYDGLYHILSTGADMAGIPSKIKFKMVRDSSNIITSYEEFTCDSSNVQLTYVLYTISGSSITSTLKTLRTAEPQRSQVDLTGTLNAADPTQYTAKSGTYSYANNAGTTEGAISMTQAVDTLLLDAFDSRDSGSNVTRIYGQADQSNSSNPFAISGYTFGAGAADLITSTISAVGCWDTSNNPTTCSGSNYDAVNGHTPQAVSTQTVSDFSGSAAWDCSGTVEVTHTESMGDTSSCFARFTLDSEHIDCTTATQGNLTVTPSVSGTTLSTSAGSPTDVSTTPSIVLTASRALDTSSTNSSTVTLVKTSDNSSVSLTYTNSFNSDNTVETFNPTLVSGQTYKLTLVGSSTTATRGTVIRTTVGNGAPPADQLQSTGTYYITAH